MSIGQPAALTSDQATQRIRDLAERQHGVVSRRQLIDIGLGRGLVRDRVRSGRLVAVHRGVFALGHGLLSRRGRWMAAVLACGAGSVLSHGSAAHLWDLRRSRGSIEVSRCSGGTRRRGMRLHQAHSLRGSDVTVEAGIPTTTMERTLLDIAGGLDLRQLERAVVAGDRSGRLRWPELERVIAEGAGRTGIARLRLVAAEVDPRAVHAISPLEVDFLALCRKAGIAPPEVNVLVEGCLVDFLWPAERVIVETDGYRYHGGRPAFEQDHETTVALIAAGYDVHRATWRMLDQDPTQFLSNVQNALERRRQRIMFAT